MVRSKQAACPRLVVHLHVEARAEPTREQARLLVGERELEVAPRALQLPPGRLVPRVGLLLTEGAHKLGHVPRRVVPRRAREHRRGKGAPLLRQLGGGHELLLLHGAGQRQRKVPPRGRQASGCR